jgi:16S rRNA (cytosine1402-N4)-methyltransferase
MIPDNNEDLTTNQPSSPAKPRRRPRYPGKNPRRFGEKYKERNPDKYPDTIQKVLASGKTPAGTHRPICVREILEVLAPRPGEIVVDATLGYGGHAMEILRRIQPGGRLIGLDVDSIELPKTELRLRASAIPPEVLTVWHSNFAGLPKVLASLGIEGVDGVLADLGCSSMQLDDPSRGFSFKIAGPLDLRMNPAKGYSAAALLASMTEEKLGRLLQENSDEPHAALLAHAITQARSKKPIQTTQDLTNIIRDALATLPKKVQAHEGDATTRRVFQALRIAVNDEFSALDSFLRTLPDCLNPAARVAILSFHSGEDRRVKKSFQAGRSQGVYSRIADEVIRPNPEEVRSNPRSASAKLRWAIRNEG